MTLNLARLIRWLLPDRSVDKEIWTEAVTAVLPVQLWEERIQAFFLKAFAALVDSNLAPDVSVVLCVPWILI